MRGRQVNADACAETFLIETKRQRKEIASRLRYENYVAELQLRNQPLGRIGPKMVTFMLGKSERGPGILQQRAASSRSPPTRADSALAADSPLWVRS